jgi:hypothetical protein
MTFSPSPRRLVALPKTCSSRQYRWNSPTMAAIDSGILVSIVASL